MYILREIQIPRSTAKSLRSKGWHFDWSASSEANTKKVCLTIDDEIEGLVEFRRENKSSINNIYMLEVAPQNRGSHRANEGVAGTLLAYVAHDSFSAGFDGFVVLVSKTILAKHYIEKYGATRVLGDRLVFDTIASKKLIQVYLERDDVYYE